MKKTNDQMDINCGTLLYEIKHQERVDSGVQTFYVEVSSPEDLLEALKVVKLNLHGVVNVSLIASELKHPLAPAPSRLIVRRG